MSIINKFTGKFYILSMQKYSSNVVEKILEQGSHIMIERFVEEVCSYTRVLGIYLYLFKFYKKISFIFYKNWFNKICFFLFLDLMKSSFGNYVVQKALKVSNLENKNKLIDAITKNIEKLNDKKLVTKWKQIIFEASGKRIILQNENFKQNNMSHNVSPNTSFNSANSNVSNNSRNSGKPNKNYGINSNFNMNLNNNQNYQNTPNKGFSKSYNGSPVSNNRMETIILNNSNINYNIYNGNNFILF